MKLEDYFEDGANYQAQAVMCLVKGWYENIVDDTFNDKTGEYEARINVGRYENCREQGYIFSLVVPTKNGQVQRNYAVYEHRNSDAICLVVFDLNTAYNCAPLSSDVYDKMKDKWDTTKDFFDVTECATYIRNSMVDFIEENYKKDEK